jgi:prepilin-type N-terminal cleavage/methylation domain-containing protein
MPITSSASSSNARPRPASRSGQRGFTIAELTVSLFLMSIISLIFYQIFIGTMRTNMMLESHNDLAMLGQRSVNFVKEEVLQSKVLYQDDSRGQSYLAKLSVPTGLAVLSGSLLPVIDTTTSFVPDSATRRTGNSLLLLREQVPSSYWIDHDADSGTADIEALADLYTFQYLYLTQNPARSFKGLGYYLDLITAGSQPYASYVQISGMTATARAAVAQRLTTAGVNYALDPWKDAGQAFYQLASDGTLTGPVDHTIDLSLSESLLPEFRGGRIAGKMNYSVGVQLNPALATIEPINLYAQANGAFPGGLETQIVGASSARKVMVRLMLVAEYGDKLNSHVNTVTSTTSEF